MSHPVARGFIPLVLTSLAASMLLEFLGVALGFVKSNSVAQGVKKGWTVLFYTIVVQSILKSAYVPFMIPTLLLSTCITLKQRFVESVCQDHY